MADVDLHFDGRTLGATVIVDVADDRELLESGVIVHHACRGPLLRMVVGSTEIATDAERAELGALLANYDVADTARAPRTVRHKFLINTDEDGETVANRIRRALGRLRGMVVIGECDRDEAAQAWRIAQGFVVARAF